MMINHVNEVTTRGGPIPENRIAIAAERLANFLRVSNEELKDFARLTGYDDVQDMSISDLCTTSSEISGHTDIEHV